MAMWIEKIRRGVLHVSTDSGLRFVEPSLRERIYLLWTFRNFHILSEEILKPQELQLMRRLCNERRLMKPKGDADSQNCVIGIVELPKAPVTKKFPRPVRAHAQKTSA